MTASERVAGERVRIGHAIARLRAILEQVERTLDVDAPPGPDVGQAVAHSGADLACSIARLESYMRVRDDERRPPATGARDGEPCPACLRFHAPGRTCRP